MSLTSLVLVVAIFSVPLLSVAGLSFVARRLRRRPEVPRFVASVGYTFATAAGLVIVGGSASGVLRSMGAVSGESEGASQKGCVLAKGI